MGGADCLLSRLKGGCSAALQVLKIPQGDYLLQNGANSVLGKQLIALAHKRGIKTINIVRTRDTLCRHRAKLNVRAAVCSVIRAASYALKACSLPREHHAADDVDACGLFFSS